MTVPLVFGENQDDQSSLFPVESDMTVGWDDRSIFWDYLVLLGTLLLGRLV